MLERLLLNPWHKQHFSVSNLYLTEPSLAAMTKLMGANPGADGAIATLNNAVDPTQVVTPPPAAPSTSAPRGKRGKHLHISDTNVRRSSRVHSKTQGFKSPSCRDKNCLGCSTNPPSLSSSVVRELGSTFCQLEPAALTDDQLNAKHIKPSTVGRPKSKKAKKSDGDKKGDKDGAGPSKTKK
jgi:hypothetical protein